jgi:nitroimidazol reductase NimA-like FMN-containing flavoprotein (pyridoxamine 5'-phosphate oxidase superfamily)
MTSVPIADRPHAPGYGLEQYEHRPDRYPWSRASASLAAARNYWVSTATADGRPHATPVWGLWLDGAFYFGAGRDSRKARNIAAQPRVIVHLESGDDVVIIEGDALEVRDESLRERLADAYDEKYEVRPPPEGLLFEVRPERAFTWYEPEFPETATRWVFRP